MRRGNRHRAFGGAEIQHGQDQRLENRNAGFVQHMPGIADLKNERASGILERRFTRDADLAERSMDRGGPGGGREIADGQNGSESHDGNPKLGRGTSPATQTHNAPGKPGTQAPRLD